MIDLSPQAIAAARAQIGVSDDLFPRSIAIIMDGNGRWARDRQLPRTAGHQAGCTFTRNISRESGRR